LHCKTKKGRIAAAVKNTGDFSVVFTKKIFWTSATVLGIIWAKAEEKAFIKKGGPCDEKYNQQAVQWRNLSGRNRSTY